MALPGPLIATVFILLRKEGSWNFFLAIECNQVVSRNPSKMNSGCTFALLCCNTTTYNRALLLLQQGDFTSHPGTPGPFHPEITCKISLGSAFTHMVQRGAALFPSCSQRVARPPKCKTHPSILSPLPSGLRCSHFVKPRTGCLQDTQLNIFFEILMS